LPQGLFDRATGVIGAQSNAGFDFGHGASRGRILAECATNCNPAHHLRARPY
jgi:hypothetical protein